MKRGRSDQLIQLRNKVLIARYYYWAEIWEKSCTKAIEILSLREFFIGERTIQNEIAKNETYLNELRTKKPTIKELECLYPGFCWRQTMTIIQQSKKSTKATL
jgi:hypothetical protein